MQTDALMIEQASLEYDMYSNGVAAYQRKSRLAKDRGVYTDSPGFGFVLRNLIEPTETQIELFINDAVHGKPGRNHAALPHLKTVDVGTLAFIASKVAINCAAREWPVMRTALQIGIIVELEARLEAFANKPYMAAVLKDLEGRTSHADHRRKTISVTLGKQDDGWVPWSKQVKLRVGIKLVELFIKATRSVEICRLPLGRHKTINVLRLTPAVTSWALNTEVMLELYQSDRWPMIVKPVAWDKNLLDGGYLGDAAHHSVHLVKQKAGNGHTPNQPGDMTQVIDAINSVQDTAWKVNTKLLDILEACIRQGKQLADLPMLDPQIIPPFPKHKRNDKPAIVLWKRTAKNAYMANKTATSRRADMFKIIGQAKKFSAYLELFFPHQLDFRGRMYSRPIGLSPQGADLSRSLLLFAEGKPLDTDKAVGWFFIHGANTYGEDKLALDERIGWVSDNTAAIIEAGTDPLAHTWWQDADKPWAFLAWCIEYAAWDRDPESFLSHIPIAIDGSCNGIQHFSAMLRDPVGGAAVNLLPSDSPSDIYQEVANVVAGTLTRIADTLGEDTDMAKSWLSFGIDRKMCKRPVMVLPYGGTRNSCTKYVVGACIDHVRDGKPNPFGDEEELSKAAVWLSQIVWASIGDVVVSSREAMGYLQKISRTASLRNQSTTWTTPSGFTVTQSYNQTKQRRVGSKVLGSILKMTFKEDIDKIDARRQNSAIAPNFVHSLDAAALTQTVNMANDNGVNSFAVIHDSFGSHAKDMDVLASCTRHAFVDMYQDNDVLAQFRDSVGATLTPTLRKRLEPVPEMGELNIEEVLESPYFFA